MIFLIFILSWFMVGFISMFLYMIKIDGMKEIYYRIINKTTTFFGEIGFGSILGYILPIILFFSLFEKK